jgi:spectinomycin phosphotransferase
LARADPISAELARFLRARNDQILDLIRRAERLAQALQARSPAFVLCHSDIHAGNVLVEPGGALYIVDWDEPILAPKERDLMFIGAGLWGQWRGPQEEEALFYRGYGRTWIDPRALAYYRYARIVEDIAIYCEWIVHELESQADREQSLRYLQSNFLPDSTIEIAYASDGTSILFT